MNGPQSVAGLLLVAGPVLGLVPVGHPALVRIWSMPRPDFVATVAVLYLPTGLLGITLL